MCQIGDRIVKPHLAPSGAFCCFNVGVYTPCLLRVMWRICEFPDGFARGSIIKNYGFLWERQHINRGTGGAGKAGHLKGFRDGAKNNHVDFCEQIGVYALYDRNQTIVYIGQAGNGKATLFARLKQHMDGSQLWNRWEYFSWVGFKGVTRGGLNKKHVVGARVSQFTYGAALNEIEGILIELIEPKLNKQGGRLKRAIEYFQFVDEQTTLQTLKEKIDQLICEMGSSSET